MSAVDAAGNTSSPSGAVSATTAPADTSPPSQPTGLVATVVSNTQINLAWTASIDNVGVTGYRVFRNGTQIATPTATTFNDTGLTAGTTYSYSITAVDAAGNLSRSQRHRVGHHDPRPPTPHLHPNPPG